jgi:hypothetical protein
MNITDNRDTNVGRSPANRLYPSLLIFWGGGSKLKRTKYIQNITYQTTDAMQPKYSLCYYTGYLTTGCSQFNYVLVGSF